MRGLLALLIRTYWALVSEERRRPCLFAVSCSRHVYKVLQSDGPWSAARELCWRWRHCRAGYQVSVTDERLSLTLEGGTVLDESVVAPWLVAEHRSMLSMARDEIGDRLAGRT